MTWRERLALWLMQMLWALLLLLGAEILLWRDPPSRRLDEWLLLLVGYYIVAVLVLDTAMRARVRDLWGVMLLAGVAAVLNVLFLNPLTTLSGDAGEILTRVNGALWLLSLEMFGVYVVLCRGKGVMVLPLWAGSIIVGFFWAVLVWWTPAFMPGAFRPVILEELFAYLMVPLVPLLIVYAALRQHTHRLTASRFLLGARDYALVILALLSFFIWNVLQGAYTQGLNVALVVLILVVCAVILWFRSDTQKPPLLTTLVPMQAPAWPWLIVAVLLLCGAAVLGMLLPLVELFGWNQYTLLQLGFTLVGAGWLPLVAAVLGLNAFSRQTQRTDY